MLIPVFALSIAQSGPPDVPISVSAELVARVRGVVEEALVKYKVIGLTDKEIGIALIQIDGSERGLQTGSFRGGSTFYPASVIKLFYLAYAESQLRARRLKRSDELSRALEDMIRESSNDATHYVVDAISGTTGGVELPSKQLSEWSRKRQAVNRWFAAQGFVDVNACQKTWCEGPYGREAQFVGKDRSNRNRLTPLAAAVLMAQIALRKCVSPEASERMLGLLRRQIPAETPDADNQSKEFTGSALPKGSKLWSKAGWTSSTKHDVALVELPNGRRLVVAIFTLNHSNDPEMLPWIAGRLIAPYLE